MNPAFSLAQVGATSLYTVSTSTASNSVVIGLLIVALAVIILLMIRNQISQARSSQTSSLNKSAFRRAARSVGLEEDNVRFLEGFARSLAMPNPDFTFRNRQKLEAFFKDCFRQIEKSSDSEAEAEDRKARLFLAREQIARRGQEGAGISSTRQLGRGLPLTFIAPGEASYPSVVLAVEPTGLAIEAAIDSYGAAIHLRRGTKVSCYFYAKNHQGYQFQARVIGWEKIGVGEAMVLGHSDAVTPLPARLHERREMRAPCTFYRVAVSAEVSKGKKGKARVEKIAFPGTITDISAGGIGIQTANPLQAGEYVKIVFSALGRDQAAFAKVLKTNRAGMGGIMHLQFVRISRQGLNTVMTYVYGYSE